MQFIVFEGIFPVALARRTLVGQDVFQDAVRKILVSLYPMRSKGEKSMALWADEVLVFTLLSTSGVFPT